MAAAFCSLAWKRNEEVLMALVVVSFLLKSHHRPHRKYATVYPTMFNTQQVVHPSVRSFLRFNGIHMHIHKIGTKQRATFYKSHLVKPARQLKELPQASQPKWKALSLYLSPGVGDLLWNLTIIQIYLNNLSRINKIDSACVSFESERLKGSVFHSSYLLEFRR